MIVFLNGQFVPEAEAKVPVFDRSFLYGDGLFETIRVANGKPFLWSQHLDRLERGAGFLGIKLPFSRVALAEAAAVLVSRNRMPDAVLRLTLSRGVGRRGYSTAGAGRPTLVMTLHPLPVAPAEGWRLVTSTIRLPAGNPLAQFKTANKLLQVLARAEAEAAGADEALLLNSDGCVAEAASGNLFVIRGGVVLTPPLAGDILPGVTRAILIELCAALDIPVQEQKLPPAALAEAEGVFVTLSTLGIVPVTALDGQPVRQTPLTARLRTGYDNRLAEACGCQRQESGA